MLTRSGGSLHGLGGMGSGDSRMKVPHQQELAWDLVDAARTSLDISSINRVLITIASVTMWQPFEIPLVCAARSMDRRRPPAHGASRRLRQSPIASRRLRC